MGGLPALKALLDGDRFEGRFRDGAHRWSRARSYETIRQRRQIELSRGQALHFLNSDPRKESDGARERCNLLRADFLQWELSRFLVEAVRLEQSGRSEEARFTLQIFFDLGRNGILVVQESEQILLPWNDAVARLMKFYEVLPREVSRIGLVIEDQLRAVVRRRDNVDYWQIRALLNKKTKFNTLRLTAAEIPPDPFLPPLKI